MCSSNRLHIVWVVRYGLHVIFGHGDFLCCPYRPWTGALAKNDTILDACVAHPDRFLVSPCSGDPRVLVAGLLTDPDNAVWEVWRGATLCGILILDRIVARVDARLQFVFFDDELASKAPLLNDFVARCFSNFELHRLTFEAPMHMTTLTGFARRKLGFSVEGARRAAYFDGTLWHNLAVLARFAPEV